ncbi:MAG: DMT family transporter, partial [Spirochaetia bacterium]|nr:DMT family transporter [Spirochaetia bacterium]
VKQETIARSGHVEQNHVHCYNQRAMDKLGALAAFGTALCWSFSAIFFEKASKKVGALAVNFWKVVFAFFFLALAGTVTRLMPLPFDASPRAWLYLSISGIIGFVIADFFLFNAYVIIGARVTVIFQSLTPLFTTLFAFLFLGETMEPIRLVGMGVVIIGILIVVITRQRADAESHAASSAQKTGRKPLPAGMMKGYVFAFFSSVFQALGLIFSKTGLGSYNAISGTQIRVMMAIVGFAIQAVLMKQTRQVFVLPRKDKTVFSATASGAVFGPFLGVVFSLFALQNTQAGTASTLMALTPILIIPPSVILLKQKVKAMEIVGAIIAVCGAALFFML